MYVSMWTSYVYIFYSFDSTVKNDGNSIVFHDDETTFHIDYLSGDVFHFYQNTRLVSTFCASPVKE